MSWTIRFFKRIPILGGLARLNLSRSGVSVSVGESPVTANVSKRGTRLTISAPGTGLSAIKRWRR